jgi:hypothetical protein
MGQVAEGVTLQLLVPISAEIAANGGVNRRSVIVLTSSKRGQDIASSRQHPLSPKFSLCDYETVVPRTGFDVMYKKKFASAGKQTPAVQPAAMSNEASRFSSLIYP